MKPVGLSAKSRGQLSRLLRDSPPVVTPSEAAGVLGVDTAVAARRLAAWSRAGWLAAVGAAPTFRSRSSLNRPMSRWRIRGPSPPRCSGPCYIGGWSAAEHWGLTEQIFRSLCVMTTKRPRNRKAGAAQGTLRASHRGGRTLHRPEDSLARRHARAGFGPGAHLVDMLADPALAAVFAMLARCWGTSLHVSSPEAPKLADYASQARHWCSLQTASASCCSGIIPIKALLIELCRQSLSAGYAKLDPALPADRLVTAWRVWVPASELREPKP
jgi:hypothetical protein